MTVLFAIFTIVCVVLYGISLKAVVCFALFVILSRIALADIKTMEIPPGLITALAIVSIAAVFVFPGLAWYERLFGVFTAGGILLVITLIVPGAFGGGDIKMMAVCGIMLGWKMSIMALVIAIFAGGLYVGVLLLCKRIKRKDKFAFGPFLCIGVAAAFIWGDIILDTYLQISG